MNRGRNDIESSASELLRQFNPSAQPVDVENLAVALGAQVHYQDLEDSVSGALVIKGDETHVFVNRSHHPNRQRFTIAHELGHLVLHGAGEDRLFVDTTLKVYQRVGQSNSSAYTSEDSSTTPEEEREANNFAAALLMPRPLLEAAAFKSMLADESDIAALARDFQVSEQAMSIRLQRLGLIEPFSKG